jgi:hypothetical protein
LVGFKSFGVKTFLTLTLIYETAHERFFVEDPRLASFSSSGPNAGSASNVSPWSAAVAEVSTLFDRSVQDIQADVEVFLTAPREVLGPGQLLPDASDPSFEQ